jgi:hypothetical protein
MFIPEARQASAMLKAYRQREASGGDLDQLYREILAGMMAANDPGDDAIDELIWNAPVMTPAQLARIRRHATAAVTP